MILSHRGLYAMLKPMAHLYGGFTDSTGKLVITDDRRKPYVLRTVKGLSPAHAPLIRFSRRKPRYRRYRGVLVMGKREARKSLALIDPLG